MSVSLIGKEPGRVHPGVGDLWLIASDVEHSASSVAELLGNAIYEWIMEELRTEADARIDERAEVSAA
jgi:hypothetical protein